MSTLTDNIDLTSYLRTSVDDKNKNIKNSSGITKFIVRIHTKLYAYIQHNEVHNCLLNSQSSWFSIAVSGIETRIGSADAILFQAE